MPRVTHVKKARKDNPVCKAGESYYWWKFRYGGKRYSLTRPRPSQLTQSEFYSTTLSIDEVLEETFASGDALRAWRDESIEWLNQLADDCSDKQNNMPDSLMYSPTGQLLEDRANGCYDWVSQLESVDLEDLEEYEDEKMYWEEKREELASCNYGIE